MGYLDDLAVHSHALHRKRVHAAKAIIDNKPPIINAANYSGFSKLKADVYTFTQRNRTNCTLMAKLNRVVRTRGVIDSFRTAKNTPHSSLRSTIRVRIREQKRIEKENMILGKNLVCMKGLLDTWQKIPLSRDKKREKRKAAETFSVPHEVLSKYPAEDIPTDRNILQKLLRPKIWFQLEVKGIRPLGMVSIQLYTEAAPMIVSEFVHLCNAQDHERLKFVRLFPCLWQEGELKLSEDSIVNNHIEYDMRVLDHGSGTGILSFSLPHMKTCLKGYMYYTISFKPLRVLNGHRVGFGRIVSGLKILNCIQDYGTKNGKPTKEIIVSSCGLFK